MNKLKSFSYNVFLAQALGPLSAIYLSLLSSYCANEAVVTLSRRQIYSYCGLPEEKQREVENFLDSLNILNVKAFKGNPDKSYYSLNEEVLKKFLDNPCEARTQLSKVSPLLPLSSPPAKKETKLDTRIKKAKKAVREDDPAIVQLAYDWIDSVFEKGGFITSQAVKLGVEELSRFTSDVSVKAEVYKIATKGAWRELSWAIEKLKNNSVSGNNFARYEDIRCTEESTVREVF